MGGIIEALVGLPDHEYRTKKRLEEVQKLEEFKTFELAEKRCVPANAKVFGHRWADVPNKSRFTVQDFKKLSLIHISEPTRLALI
eukprot:8617375-Alexandrium_andersonii.AAC.1